MANLDLNALRQSIEQELKVWDQPSLAVGIIKDGEVVLNEGFGFRNVEQQLKADADTLYQIGSCSKAFTAAAAAILVDRGILEWDRPVHDYLPWLRFKDDFVTLHVTTRDMLCHRTGLPRHDAYWIDGPCTRQEMAENLRNMTPGWSFREHWCYQNTCFVTVGVLIEQLTGKTWEQFVQEEILDPLGMNRTMFFIDQMRADDNYTTPYERALPTDLKGFIECAPLKSIHEDWEKGVGSPYGPAGSIISTVNDMLKWISFHLGDGKVGDRQIISEENLKELHKPQMLLSEPLIFPFPEQDFFSYAMGWFTETHRGHQMVEHGGNVNGFSALATMIPDQNLGIVTLANFDNSFDTYSTTYKIVDAYLGVEDGNWDERWRNLIAEIFSSMPEQMKQLNGEPKEGTSPSHALEAFAGSYRNACYGEIVITKEGDLLKLVYNQSTCKLKHFHYDVFQIDNPKAILSDMLVSFTTGKNGEVDGLEIGIALNPAVPDEFFKKEA